MAVCNLEYLCGPATDGRRGLARCAQTKCPLYVRKSVWEEHSTPMRELGRKTPDEVRSVAAVEDPSSVATLLRIRRASPAEGKSMHASSVMLESP